MPKLYISLKPIDQFKAKDFEQGDIDIDDYKDDDEDKSNEPIKNEGNNDELLTDDGQVLTD